MAMADETDALIQSELRNGCTGEVEARLDNFRKSILENKVTYSATTAEDQALDRLSVNLLRLGLFDELLHLVRQHKLPFRPEFEAFINYCESQYAECRRRGEAYRARYPNSDIFTMGCIVWGDEYVGNFLRYNLRSMLSPNNLPALRRQGQVVCSIVTDAAGELRMRQAPSVRPAVCRCRHRIHHPSGRDHTNPCEGTSGRELLHSLRDARPLLHLLCRGCGLTSVHDTGRLHRCRRVAGQYGELPARGIRMLRRRKYRCRDGNILAGA